MTQKFHINKHGVPAICRATKGNCPLGGPDGTKNHFDTEIEAQRYADKVHEESYSLLPDSSLNLSPAASQKVETQMVIMRGKIDPNKFVPPTGNLGNNKPETGGFWTSTQNEDGESGWTKWARRDMFYRYKKKRVTWDIATVKISQDANVLTIDNAEDYKKIIEKYKEPDDKYAGKPRFRVTSAGPDELLDYDLLMKDYDAVRVTENAIKENPVEFSHWSCESTVWFNLDKFENVEYNEKGYKEKNLL